MSEFTSYRCDHMTNANRKAFQIDQQMAAFLSNHFGLLGCKEMHSQ